MLYVQYECIHGPRQISSYPNKPCMDGKLIYSDFRLCINLNLTLMTGFVVQGHIIILMQYGHALIGYFSLFMALKNIKLLQRTDFVFSFLK